MKIKAPFSGEQVRLLNRYQRSGWHPYTCGALDRTEGKHKEYAEAHGGDYGELIATPLGWECPTCHYKQDWASIGSIAPRSSSVFGKNNGARPTMVQYCIYDHPADYPDLFVVRAWEIFAGIEYPIPGDAQFADTLEAARALIPPDKVKVDRFTEDDPYIVECWI